MGEVVSCRVPYLNGTFSVYLLLRPSVGAFVKPFLFLRPETKFNLGCQSPFSGFWRLESAGQGRRNCGKGRSAPIAGKPGKGYTGSHQEEPYPNPYYITRHRRSMAKQSERTSPISLNNCALIFPSCHALSLSF